MKQSHLTLKVFLLIVLNDVGDTVAQFFMKKGLARTGIASVTFSNLSEFITRNAGSGFLWLGLAIFMLNFFVWIVILYKVDISIAMPVGSTSYVFVPLVAVFFLGEHISLLRWMGIMLIVLGIHFVSRSKKDRGNGMAAI